MRKRIAVLFATLIAAFCSVAVVSPAAEAYLHVENAYVQCKEDVWNYNIAYTQSRFPAWQQAIYRIQYVRYADDDVYVMVQYYNLGNGDFQNYNCHYVGTDSTWGVYFSFRYVGAA